MKRIVETTDGGFDAMLGEKICVFCSVYIYTGVVAGVNDHHIELSEPKLVYETGSLTTDDWSDAQALPTPWRIQIDHIESWGVAKC